jgi:hypothetical protein
MRLNIYADTGEGKFVPLFTLNNILVDHWRSVSTRVMAATTSSNTSTTRSRVNGKRSTNFCSDQCRVFIRPTA